jgi:prephenate dehydrogenase
MGSTAKVNNVTSPASPTGKVTLIGLGTRGTALGLALAKPELNLRVVGCDRDAGAAKRALASGAIHHVERNSGRACEGSDLVVLAVPFLEVRPVLESIAAALKVDAVVVETAPLKTPTFGWAAQAMPRDRHLVGAYLIARSPTPEPPTPLFDRALMIIVAPRGSDSTALEFTARLAPTLGASTFFVDAEEFDGLMAGTRHLPLLLSLACYRAVTEAPGWRDGQRIADDTFAEATSLLTSLDAPRAAAELAANRENLARRLGLAIEQLEELRRILAGDETQTADELETLLREAMQGRRRWMQARSDPSHDHADQRPEMPSLRDSFARMFGLGKDQRDIIRAAKDASTAKKP